MNILLMNVNGHHLKRHHDKLQTRLKDMQGTRLVIGVNKQADAGRLLMNNGEGSEMDLDKSNIKKYYSREDL